MFELKKTLKIKTKMRPKGNTNLVNKPSKNNTSYKKLITFVEDRPGHDFRYAIDSSKIQSELGWEPKESFNSGIEKTVKWYIENENWWINIQKKRYNQERLGRNL